MADPLKGIMRVSADGGKPELIVAAKQGETMLTPQLVPNSDTLLFTIATGDASDRWDRAQIVAQSLSGKRKILVEGGSNPRYVSTGHLIYVLGSNLLAVPFDSSKNAVTGGPIPVENVGGVANPTGVAHLGVANNGTLVYLVDNDLIGVPRTKITLIDQLGREKPLGIPPGRYFEPRVSPNGKQIAFLSVDDQARSGIWIYDVSGTTAMRRLTFETANYLVWTRDSQQIIFSSSNGSLFWQRADGTGSPELLAKPQQPGNTYAPNSVSPDGKTLALHAGGVNGDVWILPLEGDHVPKSLIAVTGSNQEHAYFSPDGRWIVYRSGETGQAEIYVQPFPPTGSKYQITTTGGLSPLWSPDGKQIFYVEAKDGFSGQLMSVNVSREPSFSFANPMRLPIDRIAVRAANVRMYDITPDGKEFLVTLTGTDTEKPAQPQVHITLNWFEELKQRVPVH
jgi:Tol biopolymer transport system component